MPKTYLSQLDSDNNLNLVNETNILRFNINVSPSFTSDINKRIILLDKVPCDTLINIWPTGDGRYLQNIYEFNFVGLNSSDIAHTSIIGFCEPELDTPAKDFDAIISQTHYWCVNETQNKNGDKVESIFLIVRAAVQPCDSELQTYVPGLYTVYLTFNNTFSIYATTKK